MEDRGTDDRRSTERQLIAPLLMEGDLQNKQKILMSKYQYRKNVNKYKIIGIRERKFSYAEHRSSSYIHTQRWCKAK